MKVLQWDLKGFILLLLSFLQLKYKEESKKELSTNLYSTLPETEEMKFAKAVMELQSEVGRAVGGEVAAGGVRRDVVWAL